MYLIIKKVENFDQIKDPVFNKGFIVKKEIFKKALGKIIAFHITDEDSILRYFDSYIPNDKRPFKFKDIDELINILNNGIAA